ncbi:copper amine oxidase N-terminal domain-containing protein [Paenibacillus abyssi]|uniref:Copper amine oxidase-like N-terminal domain-containing protein n=1 Tax=Paenibacillus abyssi TaxID=1340531 RepID=A0A917FQW9_9BACL|nr:copper amine oxidase N-terminal domain-containing protein [Paenibacillus abyssi]GGG00618.1 hypothetical protein GCM10010916_17210 [Paenibacillus abyssi]
MKQKLTVLSLAALLAVTPLSTGYAASTGAQTDSSTTVTTETKSEEDTVGSSVYSGSNSGAPDYYFDSGNQERSEDYDDSYDESDNDDSYDYESRLGDGEDFIPSFAGFDFDSDFDFEDVADMFSSLADFRSNLDKADYGKYLEKQQAENNLFTLKQGVDFDTAIDELEQSLETDPNNQALYVELALTYLASGDLSKAEEVSELLAELAPESYLSFMLQAELAGSQGSAENKQLYLEKAVESNPTSSVARFKLGEELVSAGKYNEATVELMTAAALNPQHPEVFEALNKAFAENGNTELKAFVNGVVPKFDVKPFVENGRTLVPFRAISEALGADVKWDGANQQVSIQHGDTTIQLTIDSTTAIVNGQEVTIEVPAKVVDGRTVIPLRFLGESLGTIVDWKSESKMIVISE